ncbi:MAG: DUF1853 family protein [Verrucomicrobia bacterium]|nr:DUF1853 family protein [Verrucomicrobiota bacterium]
MAYSAHQQALFSQAIFDSLLHSELLVTDLPVATRFDRSLLALPADRTVLNFAQKLGHLFEDALAATVDASCGLRLIDQGVQFTGSAGQTLGELDFLILDQARQQPIHLELAIKFYLAQKDADGIMRFPGPDPRDNWPRKLKRLTEHQLRLSDDPAIRHLLSERFGIENIEVAHLIYGCLFDHIDANPTTCAPAMSIHCRRGRWLRVSEISARYNASDAVTVLPKPLWPVPISDSLRTELPSCPVSELLKAAEQRCVMFVTPDTSLPMFLVPYPSPEPRNHTTKDDAVDAHPFVCES